MSEHPEDCMCHNCLPGSTPSHNPELNAFEQWLIQQPEGMDIDLARSEAWKASRRQALQEVQRQILELEVSEADFGEHKGLAAVELAEVLKIIIKLKKNG